MNWLEEWRSISARIEGLIKAGEYFQTGISQKASDQFGVLKNSIIPEFDTVCDLLHFFFLNNFDIIPAEARNTIDEFLKAGWKHKLDHTLKALAPLLIFRSEFDYLIRNAETDVVNLTELAFEHLRRSIVVNEDLRAKWAAAFDHHETACEKLGAIHLLGHGLWAYKVTGINAATDLVFNDIVDGGSSLIRRTARGLVLTEWKLVKEVKDIQKKANEARLQAQNYSSGILGGTELKGTRYIILVSEFGLTAPKDFKEGGVIYRHINIPINIGPPSADAKKRSSDGRENS